MRAPVLIVESRFYEDLADALVAGAVAVLDGAGGGYRRAGVPGVWEIPATVARRAATADHAGYVALGIVVLGETLHGDVVFRESMRALMDLAVGRGLLIGNGIQVTSDEKQAWARCSRSRKDRGGAAARALLAMTALHETGPS